MSTSIGIIFKSVERDKRLPEDVLKGLISKSRSLHQQWDMMQVKHGKLWRKLFLSDGIISNLQLVVPHSFCHHILRELHVGLVGGHLGQDKLTNNRHPSAMPLVQYVKIWPQHRDARTTMTSLSIAKPSNQVTLSGYTTQLSQLNNHTSFTDPGMDHKETYSVSTSARIGFRVVVTVISR